MHLKAWHAAIAVACCCLLTARATAPADSNPLQAQSVAKLDSLLEGLDALAMFNGSVIIDRGGGVEYRRDIGMADYGLGVKVAPDTRFRIASLSKLYTDAVVASLVEKQILSPDQTVDTWLPDFPNAGKVRLSHIMEHSSGIPHTNEQEWGAGDIVLDRAEIVRRLSELPPEFEPGTERRYSNGGYAVLVAALEKATGLPWPKLMEREVLRPLGLENTQVVEDSRRVFEKIANGYEPGPTIGSRRQSRPYAIEMRPGGGDMIASAGDVQRFFSAIWRDDFAGESGDEWLRTGEQTRAATGRSPGFYSAVLYEPARDILVVSLANNYAADFNWAESLAAVAMGRDGFIQGVPELAQKPWQADQRFMGPWRYEIERYSQSLTVRENADGSLYIDDDVSQTRAALLPRAGGGYVETLYFGLCDWAGGEGEERIRCSRWYPEGFVADFVRR